MKRKNLIINIRGTSGSGKSTVVRMLIKKYSGIPLYDDNNIIWAYKLLCKPKLYILGRYDVPCGGTDVIKPPRKLWGKVKKLVKNGDVIFEGLFVSQWAGRSIDLVKSLPNCKIIFAFLDTPLKICIKNVLKRRKQKGNTKFFDSKKSLIPIFNGVKRCRRKLEIEGLICKTLSYKNAAATIIKWGNYK